MKKYLVGIGIITTFMVCLLTITYSKGPQVFDRDYQEQTAEVIDKEYQGQTTEVDQNDSRENAEQENEVKDDKFGRYSNRSYDESRRKP